MFVSLYIAALSIVGFGLLCLCIDIYRVFNRFERNYGVAFYAGWILVAAPVFLILYEILLTRFAGAPGREGYGFGAQGIMTGVFTLVPGLVLMFIGFIYRQ
jgi:hypothetical protein